MKRFFWVLTAMVLSAALLAGCTPGTVNTDGAASPGSSSPGGGGSATVGPRRVRVGINEDIHTLDPLGDYNA